MNQLSPKTVTFNADSRTEAQHRSARLGARVIGSTLGLASTVLGGVAMAFNLRMAHAVAGSWGELALLAAIALGLTLTLAGMPVATALIGNRPADIRRGEAFWWAAFTASVAAGLFCVFAGGPGRYVPTLAEATRVAELHEAIRGISQAEMATWRRSGDCAAPQSASDRQTCDAIHTRDETYRAEIAAIEAGPLPGMLRRLMLLALSLAAVVGAGVLGRLAVLASAESWRLGEGLAWPDPAPAASMPASDAGTSLTPLQIFDMWYAGRIRADSAAKLSASAAYADYEATCGLNGLPPVSAKRFGDLLTARAENSGGRIGKVKSAGAIFYTGLAFAGEPVSLTTVGGEDLAALPYRS